MKKWDKIRKDLEETIAIVGVVKAYEQIPEEMPVGEYPKRLIEYHEEQLLKEAMQGIPSPAEEAREARIDEFKRNNKKKTIKDEIKRRNK